MNAGFINRLVGTTIVVVAAIVFIPNILDGEKVHYKEGFKEVEAKAGVHPGTFKVFVNFIPVADITFLVPLKLN